MQRAAEQLQRRAGRRPARGSSASEMSAGALLRCTFPIALAGGGQAQPAASCWPTDAGQRFQGANSLGSSADFLVAVELDDREREARIDIAAPLQQQELEELFASAAQGARASAVG